MIKFNAKKRIYLKDWAVEIIAVVIYAFALSLRRLKILKCFDNFVLEDYLSQTRVDGIASFFAITIGIYIAVITVLATSEIGISDRLLKKRLDKRLLYVVIGGMIENLVAAGGAIFLPINQFTKHMLVISIMLSLISFVKFIILLLEIFKGNMESMVVSMDEEEKYRDTIEACLEELVKNSKNNSK